MVRTVEQAEPADNSEPLPVEWTGEVCTVARQPVLNQNGRLHGYELFLRSAAGEALETNSETAVKALLSDTLLLGLERLTNGFPAFVACSSESIIGQWVQVLPSNLTVLGIPESLDPVPALHEACCKLKSIGFQLALDSYTGGDHPLLNLVDYVSVDFSRSGLERSQLPKNLRTGSVTLMAKRLQTDDYYRIARAEGFTLFQGDYLFRPAVIKNRKVPANQLTHFEILRLLYRDPVDLKKLSALVMRDASLAFRLLRLVNSPICAVRQEVRSIESALIIIGIDTFRRFATMAILGEANSTQPSEVLLSAFLRARFCELGARYCRQEPAEQYLLGLFSLLPVMLHISMEELAPSLPLRDEVRQALAGRANRERCLLAWLERHEHADWDGCDEIAREYSLGSERLIRCYNDAVVWAHAALRSAAEDRPANN